ncbi:MAG: RHS repeat-associated core domain-containing protein [Microcoleus anatoxicus]|uniref:RHS repeat-associated core domain-containing protein n=1 Tax=Microcoleus anatoxicus TaxID=2705319 RepID=UPI00366D50D5
MARFNYDSFGNLRNASGTAASLPGNAGGDFRFQGQWLDEATGLYNFRARYYDPETGRFMSYDPIYLIELYLIFMEIVILPYSNIKNIRFQPNHANN